MGARKRLFSRACRVSPGANDPRKGVVWEIAIYNRKWSEMFNFSALLAKNTKQKVMFCESFLSKK
uniref:Uncharacterized protein n=1 Tax=Romanomermis culicivorax TaxID=13658 RepID=A0A915L8I6_ROMCU